ncbi:hypothetical protein F511_08849 [Dorcoceras hygrometricum]|uniref:Vesicle transport protein n=1 Tax=Dorcoceras hygrometricum TaxID=472368 RepID=A0A2Z7AGH7_9LAMI|nr:hypothetical protein F511_08849 [Dorcoceras hygrometricum]
MQQTSPTWFTGGTTSETGQPTSSLLADWNAYTAASSKSEVYADVDSSFDIEAAMRTANDKVTGTFDVVSKGVRGLPRSFNSATSNVLNGKSLVYFGLFLVTGVFFIFISITLFLPVMVLKPQKFAICFTIGCAFIVGSLFALKGPKSQLQHMFSKERVSFTLGFVSSMVATVYASMVLHSYVLSGLFSVLQVIALSYYVISYFPGGSAGLKFLSSTLASSVLRCFR